MTKQEKLELYKRAKEAYYNGQEIMTDYEFDDHGNWISRKASMMGQEMVTTRTITYY